MPPNIASEVMINAAHVSYSARYVCNTSRET